MDYNELIVYVFARYLIIFLSLLTFAVWLFSKRFPEFWKNYLLLLGFFSFVTVPIVIAVVGGKLFERTPGSLFRHYFGIWAASNIENLEGGKKNLPGFAYADFLRFKTDPETIQTLLAGNYEEVSGQNSNIRHCEEDVETFFDQQNVRFYKFRPKEENEDDIFMAIVESKSLAYNEETNEAFFCWYRDDW